MSEIRYRTPHRRSLTGAPFGLASTMLRVTAAELTDPGRLMRGRRLQDDRSVLWIRIDGHTLSAEVHGSAPQPYQVRWTCQPMKAEPEGKRRALEADSSSRATSLVPAAKELRAHCECPDDAPACKHAVAVLLELADDVAHQGELLAEWRGVPFDASGEVDPDDPAIDHSTPPALRLVLPDERAPVARGAERAVEDPMASLLGFPAGSRLLAGRPRIEPIDLPIPRGESDLLRRCLHDALSWLQEASPW